MITTKRLMSLKICLIAIALLLMTYCLFALNYPEDVFQFYNSRLPLRVNRFQFEINSSVFPKQTFTNKEPSTSLNISKFTRDCTLWQFPDQLQSFNRPRITLHPNRFLYPGLIWGPNNQIEGLMHVIYLSISLNRTLVIPKFHAQYTNRGTLSPFQAIDVERLCQFVSCLSLQEFRRKCNGSLDLALQIVPAQIYHIQRFEKDTEMSLMHPKRVFQNISFPSKLRIAQSKEESEIPVLPSQNSTIKFNQRVSSDKTILHHAFDTSAQCVIALSAYNWLNIKTQAGLAMSVNEVDLNASIPELSNEVLYSIIMNNVRHPPCIVAAALLYVHEVLGDRKYVGLHWRYDKKDWLGLCKNNASWTKFVCDNIYNIKPINVARTIAQEIYNELQVSNEASASLPVYIAAPPGEEDFVNDVYKELENLNKSFTRPSMSIERFLTSRYGDCWQKHGWTNIPDIISLSEMEVMKNSFWFFHSPGSSWSRNVRPFRSYIDTNGKVKKKFERDIIKVVVQHTKGKT